MSNYVACLQADEKPGIRTNTTVCMGKIAQHLSPGTRQATLGPAFLKVRQLLRNTVTCVVILGVHALAC